MNSCVIIVRVVASRLEHVVARGARVLLLGVSWVPFRSFLQASFFVAHEPVVVHLSRNMVRPLGGILTEQAAIRVAAVLDEELGNELRSRLEAIAIVFPAL